MNDRKLKRDDRTAEFAEMVGLERMVEQLRVDALLSEDPLITGYKGEAFTQVLRKIRAAKKRLATHEMRGEE